MDKPNSPPKAQSPARPGMKPGMRPGGAPLGAARSTGAPRPNELKKGGPLGQKPPWYKRKYLVYPQFQMTLILLNSLVTLIFFFLIAFLVIRSHLFLENLVKQTRLPAQNLFIQLLSEQLRGLLIYMFIALFLGLTTTVIFTLLLSHRIAGPMIKLKNVFNDMSKTGDFPETVKFREGDFFQNYPTLINQGFNSLKKKWQR